MFIPVSPNHEIDRDTLGAMKLIIKKVPAPDATNDGGAEDGKTVDELFLAFGGTLSSCWVQELVLPG